jgi:hypothetical protein
MLCELYVLAREVFLGIYESKSDSIWGAFLR